MGHKTITISEEAYEILANLKKEKESFTGVIKRVFGELEKKPLSSFANTWEGDSEEIESIFKEIASVWTEYTLSLER